MGNVLSNLKWSILPVYNNYIGLVLEINVPVHGRAKLYGRR